MPAAPEVTVTGKTCSYRMSRDPCSEWAEALQGAGFTVRLRDEDGYLAFEHDDFPEMHGIAEWNHNTVIVSRLTRWDAELHDGFVQRATQILDLQILAEHETIREFGAAIPAFDLEALRTTEHPELRFFLASASCRSFNRGSVIIFPDGYVQIHRTQDAEEAARMVQYVEHITAPFVL